MVFSGQLIVSVWIFVNNQMGVLIGCVVFALLNQDLLVPSAGSYGC